MRHLAELFVKKGGEFSEAYMKKIKHMQENDLVGKDFIGEIDGKRVQLILPDSVKEQYKALLEAECFVNANLYYKTDEVFDLNMRVWEYAKKHMRVGDKDGYTMDDADFTVGFIEQVIVIYLSELLFPLYHRSCTKAKNLLASNLTEFMKTSESESAQLQI